MSTQKNQKEEEIDLGSLFAMIGRGISNLLNFIIGIFKEIFHFLILCLLFVKEHIVKLSIATIIGIAAGFFVEFNAPDKYVSTMLVEPNFKSTRQLYNNLEFYHGLIQQQDTASLQKVFNLSKEEAGSLKKFEITPIRKANDIVSSYNELILEVDSLALKGYSFEEFKNAFTDYDYKVHKIEVEAEQNNVFQKLDEVIIGSVIENKYFERVKSIINQNLNRTDSLYQQNLSQLDSLRMVYMNVLVEEAKKQTNGTNIDLGGEKETSKELELFETYRKLNYDLRKIAEERSEKYEVINVISNFQPVGTEIKGITKNFAFLLGCFGFGLMTFILLLGKLNQYLNNYKK